MIVLHYFPTSHWSRAVHLAVREAGVDYETQVVDITQNATFEPAYMELNPRGVVPTLVDGDKVVWDARDIARYIDGCYADDRLWVSQGAAARDWIDTLHDLPLMLFSYSVWVQAEREEKSKDILADKIARAQEYAETHPKLAQQYLRKASYFTDFSRRVYDDEHVAAELERWAVKLDELGEYMAEREWIGDGFCFADCIAASVLARLVDLGRLDGWHADEDGALRRYYERLKARDSFAYVFRDDPNIAERLRLRER